MILCIAQWAQTTDVSAERPLMSLTWIRRFVKRSVLQSKAVRWVDQFLGGSSGVAACIRVSGVGVRIPHPCFFMTTRNRPWVYRRSIIHSARG